MFSDPPARQRSNRLSIAIAIAIACAAALVATAAIGIRQSKLEITPGTAVLSVQSSEIQRLTYLNGPMTLTAQRTAPSGQFAVRVAYSDGQAARQCEASADLAGVLPQLVSINAKRQLSLRQADIDYPVKLGTLQLEDRIRTEPIPAFTVRTRANRSAIVLVFDQVAIETDMTPDVFARLEDGCSLLAANQAR